MNITSHVSSPSIDVGVRKRLHRLDPSLILTWHPYMIDPETGKTVVTRPNVITDEGNILPTGTPVEGAAWYLWRKDDVSSHQHFVMVYPHFGHRQVYGLEADLARTIAHNKLMSHMQEKIDAKDAAEKASYVDDHKARVRANKFLNRDIILEGKRSDRPAKIMSGPGLSGRGTPGTVSMDRDEFVGTADRED